MTQLMYHPMGQDVLGDDCLEERKGDGHFSGAVSTNRDEWKFAEGEGKSRQPKVN
jgi:hypothetical protein